jgi:GTPase SAR1 family protein
MIEHGFVLVGETKAGKTTLAHELVHNQLVPTATKDLDAYTLNSTYKPKKLGEAVIGSGHES